MHEISRLAVENSGGKKMTAWVGPHPDGQEKGEKELKSQEGRVLIFVLSLPSLLVLLNIANFLPLLRISKKFLSP
jgi:hypothetical protein